MKKEIYLLLAFFFLLSCSKVTSTSSEEVSSSIEPSATYVPSLVSTQTSSPTLTETSTTSPAQATQEFLINNYSSSCDRPDIFSLETSPNKQWITLTCYTPNGYSLVLIRADKSAKWELSYYDLLGKERESAEGYIYVSHWTQDGNYVYINTFPQIDGFGFAFAESAALYRLDLISGGLTEILSPRVSRWEFYSFGLSPNDRRLAYFNLGVRPFSLIIYDLQTGLYDTISIGSKYTTGGKLFWSDDSKLVVFSAASYDDVSDSYSVSVLLWNNEKKTLSTLINSPNIALEPIKWDGESKIVLQNIFTEKSSNYEFDLEANTLSQLNP